MAGVNPEIIPPVEELEKVEVKSLGAMVESTNFHLGAIAERIKAAASLCQQTTTYDFGANFPHIEGVDKGEVITTILFEIGKILQTKGYQVRFEFPSNEKVHVRVHIKYESKIFNSKFKEMSAFITKNTYIPEEAKSRDSKRAPHKPRPTIKP